MLTNFQCEIVAYAGDGYILCTGCAEKQATPEGQDEPDRVDVDSMFIHYYGILDPEETGLSPIIRYSAEESFSEGLWCEECGDEIVEPDPNYCRYHDEWRAWQGGKDRAWCQYAVTSDGKGVRLEYARECEFLEEEPDPNPRAVRWTPCPECHAGDGQRHREGCSRIGGAA